MLKITSFTRASLPQSTLHFPTALGAVVLSEPVVRFIRREVRRVVQVMVDENDVRKVLQDEVIKRDVLEGDKAAVAAKQVTRAEGKTLRRSSDKDGDETAETEAAGPAGGAPTA